MITWTDEYSVGIQEIDEQHKCIVNYINELYVALAGGNRDAIVDVVQKMVEYTKIHFAVEESLMRVFNYSEYVEHKAIHDNIIQRVLQYQGRVMAGDSAVGMELISFLKDWLFDHIIGVDKRYADTFIKAGAKTSWFKKFW